MLCAKPIYTRLKELQKKKKKQLSWMLRGKHGEGKIVRHCVWPRICCVLSAEGMKRGSNSGFMPLKQQPSWVSLTACSPWPSKVAPALCWSNTQCQNTAWG